MSGRLNVTVNKKSGLPLLTGLSELQRRILLDVYQRREAARGGNWGVKWPPRVSWYGSRPVECPCWTRAQQAAVSRALARLEHRGYLLRNNDVSGRPGPDNTFVRTMRTTCVKLLPAGLELADQLTKIPVPTWASLFLLTETGCDGDA
jgi:hypothetical protein